MYSRNKDDPGINVDARDFPDDELDDFLFDDDEVRSVVPELAPTAVLGDASLP